MTADVLSDVLSAVRLTGAVYFDFELSSPWVAEAPPSREIAGKVMPGAQRVIELHLLAHGTCWGHAVGQEPIRMREGDLIVFPQGDAHVLSSAPGMRAAPDMSAFARSSTPLPIMYELGGGGPERARVVCGFLGLDERPYNPLLTALPRVILLSAAAPGATTGWLGTLLHIAVKETGSGRAGSENVLARLSELMFVEAVRRYTSRRSAGPDRLARGTTGPGGRTGPVRAACPTERIMDRRTARTTRGPVALGLRGTIHGDGRPAADAVPRAVADAARLAPAGRGGPGGGGRGGRRLRIRSGVQPRLHRSSSARRRPRGGEARCRVAIGRRCRLLRVRS